MGMVMDMAMARDPPMLSQDMATTDMDMVMDMAMVVMDIMDTMARDLPMLSQDMATTDTDMVMDTVMDMVMDMAMDTTDKKHQSFLLCRLEFSEQTKMKLNLKVLVI